LPQRFRKGRRTKSEGRRAKDKERRTKSEGRRAKDKERRTKGKGRRTKPKRASVGRATHVSYFALRSSLFALRTSPVGRGPHISYFALRPSHFFGWPHHPCFVLRSSSFALLRPPVTPVSYFALRPSHFPTASSCSFSSHRVIIRCPLGGSENTLREVRTGEGPKEPLGDNKEQRQPSQQEHLALEGNDDKVGPDADKRKPRPLSEQEEGRGLFASILRGSQSSSSGSQTMLCSLTQLLVTGELSPRSVSWHRRLKPAQPAVSS
jgi:hypothetical protein